MEPKDTDNKSMPVDSLSLLKSNSLFAGVSDNDLENIASNIEERTYSSGQFIIHEGENEKDEFYLIKSGEVEILKKATEDKQANNFRILIISTGETIGEIALLKDIPRTASARALSDTTVLVLPVDILSKLSSIQSHYQAISENLAQLQKDLATPDPYTILSLNLAKELSKRLFNTNIVTADALKEELKLSQIRIESGRFLITVISLIVIYAFCMSAINSYAKFIPTTTLIAIPIMITLSSSIIALIWTSSYSFKDYGITLDNWKKYLIESIFWSLPVMLFIIILKWMLVQFGMFSYVFECINRAYPANLSLSLKITYTLAYVAMVPLQELIARGTIQGSLQRFLIGKYKILAAIIVSNLMFSMMHLHISFLAASVIMIFGLFWGWMYSRQGTLVGVIISHILIGVFGLFAVGFF